MTQPELDTSSGPLWWLDVARPHDPQQSAAQIRALRLLAGSSPKRIIDLGCGAGRVCVPMAEAGHQVIAVDRSAEALNLCTQAVASHHVDDRVTLREGDFTSRDQNVLNDEHAVDLVFCLGNTFMQIADVDDAAHVLQQAAAALRPGGLVVLDDIAGDFWPEVAEGYWQSGISEDGHSQMVWAADDALFALRWGDAVDAQCWRFRPDDRVCRLWSMGALGLLARLANLSAPRRLMRGHLLALRRAT